MIKIISHRGNIDGPTSLENTVDQLVKAVNSGFDIEFDVWCVDCKIYLGHDSPQQYVEMDFLNDFKEVSWIHCKNLEALEKLSEYDYNAFWHQTDDFVLTRSNHIWTFPNKKLCSKSVAVMPEREDLLKIANQNPYGICTDYPKDLLSLLNSHQT